MLIGMDVITSIRLIVRQGDYDCPHHTMGVILIPEVPLGENVHTSSP